MSVDRRVWLTAVLLTALGSVGFLGFPGTSVAQTAQQGAAKPIGTIKSISGETITLASDAGPLFTFTVGSGVKIERIEPGAKDLKNAEQLQLGDLQTGDRILVLGTVSADGHTVMLTAVVVMKKADVVSKQQREQQDWQRRGVGGLVTSIEPTAGTITISSQSFAGAKSVTIHISKDTVLRRYAPDSVKFDDAKISSIDQVKTGDQLRSRGARNSDGTEVTAEEVVFGAFQNIPGTIQSVDAAAGIISVNDLATKKSVTLKVTPESQLRKLPPQLAQLMAMRLKSAGPGTPSGGASQNASASSGNQPTGGNKGGEAASAPDNAGRGRNGGDFQQMLSRVPQTTLGDLQKGDAVMIVSTEGSSSTNSTVITLLAGVEPLLAASPNGAGTSMILPPWSLEAPGGDAAQ